MQDEAIGGDNMICWCRGTLHLLCYHRKQENQEDEEVICTPDINEDIMDITNIFDSTEVPSVYLADIASLTNMTISNINNITNEVAKEMHIHENICEDPEDPTDPTKTQHLVLHPHEAVKIQEPKNQEFVTSVFNPNQRENRRNDTPTSHLDSYPVNSHNKGTGVSTKRDDIHMEVTPVASGPKVDPR